MSNGGNAHTDIIEQRLRLGPGFGEADRHDTVAALAGLGKHVAHWGSDAVDLQVSVKDRGGKEQKVTLEAWLPGWQPLVASSTAPKLDHALAEVRRELTRQIDDQKSRKEPDKNRGSRRR